MMVHPLASDWFRDEHVILFWSMRWEERSSPIHLSNVFIFKKRPWKRQSIFCALDIEHACKWQLNNCSHLANKKRTSLRVNWSLRTRLREVKGTCILDDTIVPLNQLILPPALLLTWDNTLPLPLRSIWVGGLLFCAGLLAGHFYLATCSLLCLWDGLEMETGLLILAQWTPTILDMG